MRLIRFGCLLLLYLLAACASTGSSTAPAGGAVNDDRVNAVARQLYCPICENVSLDVCPTEACARWRDLIREKLNAGWNEQQIKDYFARQYGNRVLAEPPAQGFNWLVYLLPPLFFCVAAFVFWRGVGRPQLRSKPGDSQPAINLNDPYVARMEEELRRRQKEQ